MKLIAATVAALISNSLIIYLFARALASPEEYIDFIYKSAFAIFLLEFLSIHSSFILIGFADGLKLKKRLVKGVAFIAFYTVFTTGVTYFTGSWYPLVVFVLSMFGKVLFVKQSSSKNSLIAMNAFLLVLTVFIVALASPLIARIFPFTEVVLSQKPANSSGLLVEAPQTLLLWGVLYFTLSTIGEIWLTKNPNLIKVTMPSRQ